MIFFGLESCRNQTVMKQMKLSNVFIVGYTPILKLDMHLFENILFSVFIVNSMFNDTNVLPLHHSLTKQPYTS